MIKYYLSISTCHTFHNVYYLTIVSCFEIKHIHRTNVYFNFIVMWSLFACVAVLLNNINARM